MKITILFNELKAGAPADVADVLEQVDVVAAALAANGHAVDRLGCALDLAALAKGLEKAAPDLVFNLVEGLAGHDCLYAVVPSLLDALRIPYTGCSAEATFLTTNKLLAKDMLARAGLPTPAMPARWPVPDAAPPRFAAGRYILKPVWEHASVGMGDDAVVEAATLPELTARLARLGERTGRACFAEAFIAGREFNLSLLATGRQGGGDAGAGPAAVEVLPPAEIDFSAYPAGKPRIVGWAAKWDAGSFEYHHTPRRFTFPAADRPLIAELVRLAQACWRLFELSGYARVDFRVDAAGRPWILEVNTNPCLGLDAGFAAACAEAGLSYDSAVARIVATAPVRRAGLVAAAR